MARGQGRQSHWDDLLDDYLEDEEIRLQVEEDYENAQPKTPQEIPTDKKNS